MLDFEVGMLRYTLNLGGVLTMPLLLALQTLKKRAELAAQSQLLKEGEAEAPR